MKKIDLKQILRFLPFLPLTIFVVYARRCIVTYQDWGTAFFLGGSVALVQTAFFIYKKMDFDRFLWAINLFLITGAVGFLIYPFYPGIVNLYARFDEAMLMLWMLIVGAYTTFFTPTGFIDVKHASKKMVRHASLLLLTAAAIAFGASFYLRGDLLLAGAVPFIALRLMRRVLIEQLLRKA